MMSNKQASINNVNRKLMRQAFILLQLPFLLSCGYRATA